MSEAIKDSYSSSSNSSSNTPNTPNTSTNTSIKGDPKLGKLHVQHLHTLDDKNAVRIRKHFIASELSLAALTAAVRIELLIANLTEAIGAINRKWLVFSENKLL